MPRRAAMKIRLASAAESLTRRTDSQHSGRLGSEAGGRIVRRIERRRSSLSPAVHRHDRRTPESEVVLHATFAPAPPLVGLTPQLPVELRALREAGGAERMALRDEAAHDSPPIAAVGDRTRIDQPPPLPGSQSEPVGDELVVEAVAADHVDVLRTSDCW